MSFYRSQKCFVPVQIFCVRPKIYLHIVLDTNILCQTKRWFALSKIGFWAGTKVFEEALNAIKFLGWLKKFGLAQKILGPVEGQGIRLTRPRYALLPRTMDGLFPEKITNWNCMSRNFCLLSIIYFCLHSRRMLAKMPKKVI